ncbi:hypothetical protein ABPG75_009820 [Micractinium tetrahymenae]
MEQGPEHQEPQEQQERPEAGPVTTDAQPAKRPRRQQRAAAQDEPNQAEAGVAQSYPTLSAFAAGLGPASLSTLPPVSRAEPGMDPAAAALELRQAHLQYVDNLKCMLPNDIDDIAAAAPADLAQLEQLSPAQLALQVLGQLDQLEGVVQAAALYLHLDIAARFLELDSQSVPQQRRLAQQLTAEGPPSTAPAAADEEAATNS